MTVNSTTVVSPTQVLVSITILDTAAIGFRDVTVTTGGEVARENVPGPFLVTPPTASIPRITTVTPPQGERGQTLNVEVSGENTSFVNGNSAISFSGAGITVNSTLRSPTSASANITIAPDADLTFRDVIITTAGEVATALSAFQVQPRAAIPEIMVVSPRQGQRGQTIDVTVTGENTNFVNGVTGISFSGGGIIVNSTTVTSLISARASITIGLGAPLTLRDVTVTTGTETATASGAFEVLNAAPVCTNARPSVALITPPNRSLVPVSITGITDPEGDPLIITVTTVRQDEPVDHIGGGGFAPDSVINGATASVRAESILGTVVVGGTTFVGNGRFYHISFTATDTSSQTCTGTVKVAVPHVRTATPIDDGPLFDSTSARPP